MVSVTQHSKMNIFIILFLMIVNYRDCKIRHSSKNVVIDTQNMVSDNTDAPTDNKMTNNNQGDILNVYLDNLSQRDWK